MGDSEQQLLDCPFCEAESHGRICRSLGCNFAPLEMPAETGEVLLDSLYSFSRELPVFHSGTSNISSLKLNRCVILGGLKDASLILVFLGLLKTGEN